METLKKIGALLLVLAIAGAAVYDTILAFSINDTAVPGLATLALVAAAVPTEIKLVKELSK